MPNDACETSNGNDGQTILDRWLRRFTVRHEYRPGYTLRPLDPSAALPTITRSEFLAAREHTVYLKRRWPYYREAIDLARRLAPRRVLEVGTAYTPLFPTSDRLDYQPAFKPTYLHDATIVPWPVPDKAYDLVVALQVWEHLGTRQVEAFAELPRIARYAMLSLPYKWRRRSNPSHSNIDDEVVSRWTGGLVPLETVQLPLIGRHRRKIYLFDLGESERPPRT